jgi:hypothetical protein
MMTDDDTSVLTLYLCADCYDYAEKDLDSVVMTMWAEISISHGLIV